MKTPYTSDNSVTCENCTECGAETGHPCVDENGQEMDQVHAVRVCQHLANSVSEEQVEEIQSHYTDTAAHTIEGNHLKERVGERRESGQFNPQTVLEEDPETDRSCGVSHFGE